MVVHERERAADDSDGATLQTVRRMARYVRESAADPMVKAAADYAFERFGRGVDTPQAKAWAAFWWTKHCIKFRLDEATMWRVGEQAQQDLLISPSVLVRMKDPAEDCDGFTMMEAALLTVLGVPVVIATVAADPRRPGEWSHVFLCALLPDGPQPLDASHGIGPGWMVPPDRIDRWQAYDLNGKPVDVQPMKRRGLHGYVSTRRRGMGDTCYESVSGLPYECDASGNQVNVTTPPFLQDSTPLWGPTVLGGGSPSSSSSGSGVLSFLNNLLGSAASVARTALTPLQTVTYPGGTVVTGPAGSIPSSSFASSLSSIGPVGWVGIGLVGFLLIKGLSKK